MPRFAHTTAAVVAALLLAIGTIVPVATAPAAHAATVIALPAVA